MAPPASTKDARAYRRPSSTPTRSNPVKNGATCKDASRTYPRGSVPGVVGPRPTGEPRPGCPRPRSGPRDCSAMRSRSSGLSTCRSAVVKGIHASTSRAGARRPPAIIAAGTIPTRHGPGFLSRTPCRSDHEPLLVKVGTPISLVYETARHSSAELPANLLRARTEVSYAGLRRRSTRWCPSTNSSAGSMVPRHSRRATTRSSALKKLGVIATVDAQLHVHGEGDRPSTRASRLKNETRDARFAGFSMPGFRCQHVEGTNVLLASRA